MAVIHAVLRAWASDMSVTMRGGTKNNGRGNVFEIASPELHLSASGARKAFDAAWKRQCPYEPKPSPESRRACMRMFLRMKGLPEKNLPRSWRQAPLVPRGDDPDAPPFPFPLRVKF